MIAELSNPAIPLEELTLGPFLINPQRGQCEVETISDHHPKGLVHILRAPATGKLGTFVRYHLFRNPFTSRSRAFQSIY
ncbi:hypothetical protein RSAG8_09526, partial [Rhizoctonia solani AG-8 WAC10335]